MTGFGSKRARNIAMDSMSSKRWAEKLDKETRVTRKRMHITKQSTLPLPEVVRNIKSAPSKQQVTLYDRTHADDEEQLKWKPDKSKPRRVGGTLPSSMIYGAHISESHYKPSPFYRVNKRKEFYYGGSIDGKTVGGGNEYYLNM